MTVPSIFPKLSEGEYLVFKADVNTGILLNEQEQYYTGKQDPFFRVFLYLEKAEEFAREQLEQNPQLEITILDSSGQFVNIFRKKE